MSHKDNRDLRNTGDGGWFYAEHELFSVFAPLIGSDGVSVYMAMCRLIPLAGVDPGRQVTVRSVSEASRVSKSQTDRKMAEIVRLGMVEETRFANRRPSTYRLVSLRTQALVGIAELERRLGVPPRDTDKEMGVGQTTDQEAFGTPKTASGGSGASKHAVDGSAKSPAAPGRTRVPPGDTERPVVENTLVGLLVSQNRASVSQKEASVSQNGGSLFKELKEKELNPLLSPKGGRVASLAASADGSEDLEAAVGKVQRECGVSSRGIGAVIADAMRLEVGKTDEPVNWNAIAERMIAAYKRFLADQEWMSYKVLAPRFFAELWDDYRKWPYDEKRWRERGRL